MARYDTEVTIAGHTYIIARMSSMQQLECECILAQLFGAAAIDTLAELLEPLVTALVEKARGALYVDGRFDLAHVDGVLDRILADETSGEMIESIVGLAFDSLPGAVGSGLRVGGLSALGHVEWAKVSRLFTLAIVGNVGVKVQAGGKQEVRRITKLDDIDVSTDRNPVAKWALLAAALRHTYAGTLAEYKQQGSAPE